MRVTRLLESLRALLQEMLADQGPGYPSTERLNAALVPLQNADARLVSHLHAFFARCYQGGSFVATQPYRTTACKQVAFHWTHAGQYYVRGQGASADDFIHPDLRDFLRRELGVFIKDQLLHSEEDETGAVECVRHAFKLRRLAKPLIALLADHEDVRMRAWLKKKLVVETHYCFPLDRVPEELYAEIAANDAQRAEWVRLFDIDRLKDDEASGYSVPLSPAFLHAQRQLPVDTAFFGPEFKDRLLAAQADLDNSLSAVVLHCDRADGFALMQARYAGCIDTIYIDPPFNTDNTAFPYKNDYGHSAWLSMMDGLLRLARPLLSPDGSLFAQIDHHEATHLKMLLHQVFGEERFVNEIIWRRKQATSYSRKQLGIINDTIWWFANSATYRFVPQYTRDDEHTRHYLAERFIHLDEATGRRT